MTQHWQSQFGDRVARASTVGSVVRGEEGDEHQLSEVHIGDDSIGRPLKVTALAGDPNGVSFLTPADRGYTVLFRLNMGGLAMRTLLVVIGMTVAGGAAAANFDGVYTGTRTTNPLRPGTIGCTPANNVASKYIVRDNHFKMKMGADMNDVVVAADGTIQTSMAYRYSVPGSMNSVVRVNGKIIGDDFQMDIGNEFCATHVSLRKTAP